MSKAVSNILTAEEALSENLVLFEALNGNANLGKVLYDKMSLDDITLSARLSYLTGDYEKATELAKQAHDTYLLCEILIVTNKLSEALSVLKNESIGPVYYYYSGVIYSHLRDYEKAIACLEKAYESFKVDTNSIRKLMTLSHLAVCYNSKGEIHKSNRIYTIAVKLISKIDEKRYPRFCTKFFVNYGFQLMQNGKLHLAYKYLKMAEKLINSNRSEEYFRCKVFLGYVMKQLGYYRKAISVLENVKPTSQYLNLDRLRYLAECHMSMGNLEKSKSIVDQAMLLATQDKFAQIFLNLVSYQILNFEGSLQQAEEKFSHIQSLCIEVKDEISLSFVLGKKSCITNDPELAKIEMSKLNDFGFEFEALECSLVIATKHVSVNSHHEALTLINKMDYSLYPIQHIEALLLKALCFNFLEQKFNSYTSFNSALLLAKIRKDDLLTAKCLLTQMHICNRFPEVISLQKKYTDIFSRFEPWQKNRLDAFSKALNFNVKINLLKENKVEQISLMEFIAQTLSDDNLFIDLESQSLIYRNQVHSELQDFPMQWNLLNILAKCSSSQPLTKEMIVTQVLERSNYNPISDANNVNVTVHRLRKNLKKILGFDPIISKQGTFFLSSEYRIIILYSFSQTLL